MLNRLPTYLNIMGGRPESPFFWSQEAAEAPFGHGVAQPDFREQLQRRRPWN
jgi:hypothetical protein